MKKILPILLTLFFVLPVTNAFAETIVTTPKPDNYKNGLLDDMEIIKNITLGQAAYDNNDATYQNAGSSTIQPVVFGEIEFNGPVNITGYYVSTHTHHSSYLKFYMYDENGNEDILTNPNNTHGYKDVNIENVFKIVVEKNATAANTLFLREIDFFGSYETNTIEKYPSVTNLAETHDHTSIRLNWMNPSVDMESIIIKKDGLEIDEISKTSTTYEILNLTPETLYTFEVIAKYIDGGESVPTKITVTTDAIPPPEPAGEVTKIKASPKHNEVDLSWQLPKTDNFDYVIIYRDTLEKTFLDKLLGVATVKAAATPIFETNGTYFKDLTVQPNTKYEYTLTTLSTEKVESKGVSVAVTTLKEPAPEIEDGGYEKEPVTEDFIYTWSKPTEGEVKVMVGGKLYATVPASDGTIVIPAADMKYTILGKPDVKLIPVSPDGTEGKPISPPAGGGGTGGEGGTGEIEMPFKVNELLSTTFQIIGLLAGIILLTLAIQLVPRLIEVIKKSIRNGRAVSK